MSAVLEGGRLTLEGDINSSTVATLLDQVLEHVRNGAECVDFAAVSDVDSAAVSLALHCVREAKAANRALRFANLPPTFVNLARLYNVSDLFADASSL